MANYGLGFAALFLLFKCDLLPRRCSVQPPQMCGRNYRSRAFDA